MTAAAPTCCHARQEAGVRRRGETGSTWARNAASDRRRKTQDAGIAPLFTAAVRSIRELAANKLVSSAIRLRASLRHPQAQPKRPATSAVVNGPCVRAWWSKFTERSATDSVNALGTPTGNRDADGVTQPADVLDGRPPVPIGVEQGENPLGRE